MQRHLEPGAVDDTLVIPRLNMCTKHLYSGGGVNCYPSLAYKCYCSISLARWLYRAKAAGIRVYSVSISIFVKVQIRYPLHEAIVSAQSNDTGHVRLSNRRSQRCRETTWLPPEPVPPEPDGSKHL